MNKNEYSLMIKRAADLNSQRKEIIAMPPEKAIDRILEAKHPAALVHSFPEEDFYFLINDIGIYDAFELLNLASEKQWEYILDVELWEKDRIEINSVTKWLDILFQVDPARLAKWAADKKTDFIEFYLYKTIKVAIRDHDQVPSDLGNDFITFDDVFYFKLVDNYGYESYDPDMEPVEETYKEHKKDFIINMLEKIAEYDHIKYQNILLEAMTVVPYEMEEEFYRLKNVRLSEKGFLPIDEAAGIYASLKPDSITARKKPLKKSNKNTPFIPLPLYPLKMLKEDNLFSMSLKTIDIGETLQKIQTEFATLCNRIISADQNIIKSKDELKDIVKKACGYLSIGIERLMTQNQITDTANAATIISTYNLEHIFRTGFSLALGLKERTKKWLTRAWFMKQGLTLSFWDEEWMGVLGALLIKKPLYFDKQKNGHIYREFFSLSDIVESRKVLEEVISFDDLISLMNIDIKQAKSQHLNHKKLVLTLFARYCIGLPEEPLPIFLDDFKRFFKTLWKGKGKNRKIDILVKESFLNWVCTKTGLKPIEITEQLGRVFENMFIEIENEYSMVAISDLDTRYINLFLVQKKK
ncbi:MAG: hypothetical protein KJ882_04280 [Proteobacteria bacterium]|nr:hypothetical protein [Pseudomonadota bacterium]MBU4009961.1 hypothetical protein [Pseudomonadota bacterium]